MTLRAGDVLQIPLVDRGDARTIRVYTLVVDVVRQAGGEPVYCLRDRQGPVICLRAARLAWLRQRLGADAAAALQRLPSPPHPGERRGDQPRVAAA